MLCLIKIEIPNVHSVMHLFRINIFFGQYCQDLIIQVFH